MFCSFRGSLAWLFLLRMSIFWLGSFLFVYHHFLFFFVVGLFDMLLCSAGIDGRINVWKISEGPDEEDKPRITGKTIIAIQVVGEGEIKNPKVCWHCYKQV